MKIQGLGNGGEISYTKTITVRGVVNDTITAIKDGVESVKDTTEVIKFTTTSYISNMVNTIVENMYGR